MHELGDDDGIGITLGHLHVVEVGPLAGELGVKWQQGHEVARKGRLAAFGDGADDHLERNVPQADVLSLATGELSHEAIEVRKVRVLTLADGATTSLFAALAGLTTGSSKDSLP